MNGEIDLELYTISIIRLNTAFQKLENDTPSSEVIEMFDKSAHDFQTLYNNIIADLNSEEINFGEYYPFFQNGKITFPQYIEALETIQNEELSGSIKMLISVFTNLNKIASEFSNEMLK